MYLRVPELLSLQRPVGEPSVHDEMLFIILQQAQELWFKQVLFDVRAIVEQIGAGDILTACHLIARTGHIFRILGDEVEIMESLSPVEFLQFRGLLTPSSGFESAQFRELELASGLHDESYLRIAERVIDLAHFRTRWPVTLREAFLHALRTTGREPIDAIVEIYSYPGRHQELHALAETLGDYEMSFARWRYRHALLVERIIGSRSPGTGGSSGTTYLARTLAYRFFPELWEARNRLTEELFRNE
ncbi:MAG TPA: tryptophan 2,3-dioxygenase family protein [Chloroflexota bacterium]